MNAVPLRSAPRPSLRLVWLLAGPAFAGVVAAALPLESIDYWWSVKLGELTWRSGSLPTVDPLVYTPIREPIIAAQWLAQLIFWAVHAAGGPDLALTLRLAVTVAATVLLVRLSLDGGATVRATAIAALGGTLLVVPGLAVRPQLLAVIPFLLLTRAVMTPPVRLRWTLAVGLAVAFWANVHGSFVLTYPILAAGLAEAVWDRRADERRARLARMLPLAAICAIAPLANPHGLGLASYVLDTTLFNAGGLAAAIQVAEWGPPTIRSRHGIAFFGSIGLLIVLLARGHRPRLGEGILLLAFGLLTLLSARNVLWWGLILTPYVARGLPHLLPDPTGAAQWARHAVPRRAPAAADGGHPLLNGLCLLVLATVLLGHVPLWRAHSPFPSARGPVLDPATPSQLAEYLAGHQPPGNLFNAAGWGGYLSWRLGPDRKVFVDDRHELHPPAVWRDYAAISSGHVRWADLLDSYGVTQLALDRRAQAPLIDAVRTSPAWTLTYEDHQALVFERP